MTAAQTPDHPADEAPPVDENQIIAERRAKLARLRDEGTAYPNDFVPRHRAERLLADHASRSREELQSAAVQVSVAGRMVLKRVQGKASFATLQDATGRIQLWLNDEGVGAETHEAFKHWDLGDIIGAEGTLFRTMKGELSVRCTTVRLLAKSLRPMPDKFHGLADVEQR
jgi:lysyl-tRNA synthetase, class II